MDGRLIYKHSSKNVKCIYIFKYIYTVNYLCSSVAKASDTQAVGHGFEPHTDH